MKPFIPHQGTYHQAFCYHTHRTAGDTLSFSSLAVSSGPVMSLLIILMWLEGEQRLLFSLFWTILVLVWTWVGFFFKGLYFPQALMSRFSRSSLRLAQYSDRGLFPKFSVLEEPGHQRSIKLISSRESSRSAKVALNTIPYGRNKLYQRGPHLDNLNKLVYAPRALETSEPRSCILYGTGGIGKTQTALEFAWENRGGFDYIFWVATETRIEITRTYSLIADLTGVELKGSGSVEDQILHWLKNTGKLV